METKSVVFSVLFCLSGALLAEEGSIDVSKGCKTNPAVTGKCFSIRGRLDVYNGTPSIRISTRGSRHLLAVVPSERELMPSSLKEAVGPDRSALADMNVCPMSPHKAEEMQEVCIESATRIRMLKR